MTPWAPGPCPCFDFTLPKQSSLPLPVVENCHNAMILAKTHILLLAGWRWSELHLCQYWSEEEATRVRCWEEGLPSKAAGYSGHLCPVLSSPLPMQLFTFVTLYKHTINGCDKILIGLQLDILDTSLQCKKTLVCCLALCIGGNCYQKESESERMVSKHGSNSRPAFDTCFCAAVSN